MLWAHTIEYALRFIAPAGRAVRKLDREISAQQMNRNIERTAAWAIKNWNPQRAHKIRLKREGAIRGGRASRRGPEFTTAMIAPYIESLHGLTLSRAAERLAGGPWVTSSGRRVERASKRTMENLLKELGFQSGKPAGRSRYTWQMLDGLDGMTIKQQADHLDCSVSVIKRLRHEQRSATTV